jgi:uncharacterized membrane protein
MCGCLFEMTADLTCQCQVMEIHFSVVIMIILLPTLIIPLLLANAIRHVVPSVTYPLFLQLWTSLFYISSNPRDIVFGLATSILYYLLNNTQSVPLQLGAYFVYIAATLYLMESPSASVPIRYLEGTAIPIIFTIIYRYLYP